MTPASNRRLVALYKNNRWVEIHSGEILLVNPKHVFMLKSRGLVEATGLTVYKTAHEAEIARAGKVSYKPNTLCA